jgi:hypothetical protein
MMIGGKTIRLAALMMTILIAGCTTVGGSGKAFIVDYR